MTENTPTLQQAYGLHLGGVLCISPDLYRLKLNAIAEMVGRENDEEFRKEVREMELKMPCDID